MFTRTALALALIAAGGCSSSDDDDAYPIHPGGGTAPGGSTPGDPGNPPIDASLDAGPGARTGRVCLITDLRVLDACASTGAGGLLVTAVRASGTNPTATTSANGEFRFDPLPVDTQRLRVTTGTATTAVFTSVKKSAVNVVIPVMTEEAYTALSATEGDATVTDGQGAVVAATGTPGATGSSVPEAGPGPRYDGDAAGTWDDDLSGAGAKGLVWFPGLTTGTVSITVVAPDAGTATLPVLVEDRAITFIDARL